jgi:hypothetical protein
MTSAAARERLYDRELAKAQAAGLRFPVCNLCGLEIAPGHQWHESHVGRPKALGGKETGLAHAQCNLDDGHEVTRAVAKAKRVSRKHKGCVLTAAPLPCGRHSRWSKKLSGEVVARKSQGQKLADTLVKRRIGP